MGTEDTDERVMTAVQGLLSQLEEESRHHLEGHLTPRQRFSGWRHRRGKHPMGHRSCVLGPDGWRPAMHHGFSMAAAGPGRSFLVFRCEDRPWGDAATDQV